MADLTPKQESFCQVYIKTGNATEAYRAIYNCKKMLPATVNRKAKELLDNGKISARTKEIQAEYIEANELSPEKVLREWSKIGFADLREVIDEDGKLLPVKSWPDNVAGAVQAIKVRQEFIGSGEDREAVELIEVKLWPKTAALEALSKNLGLFREDNMQKNGLEDFSRAELIVLREALRAVLNRG